MKVQYLLWIVRVAHRVPRAHLRSLSQSFIQLSSRLEQRLLNHILPISILADPVKVLVRQHFVDDHPTRGVVSSINRKLHDVAGAFVDGELADVAQNVPAVPLRLRGRRRVD